MQNIDIEEMINETLEYVRRLREGHMVTRITVNGDTIAVLARLIEARVLAAPAAAAPVQFFQGQHGKIDLVEDAELPDGVWRFFVGEKQVVEVTLG